MRHAGWLLPLVGALLALPPWLSASTPRGLVIAALLVAAALGLVGLVLGIVTLANARGTARKARIAGLNGIFLGAIVLFGGVVLAAQITLRSGLKASTTSTGQHAERPIVDADYRFRLHVPARGWKLLSAANARRINPDAVAGAISPHGIYGMVIVERAPGFSAEKLGRLLLDNLALSPKHQERFEKLRFHDLEAVRFSASGRTRGLLLRFSNLVFVRQGFGFQLLVWGAESRLTRAEAAAQTFRRAFTLLPGKLRSRRAQGKVADAAGVGWRLRDGAFVSAAQGLAARAPKGWRLSVGDELARTNAQAELGLLHSDPDIYLVVIGERVRGVPPKRFTAYLRRLLHGRIAAIERPPALEQQVAGKPVVFERHVGKNGFEFQHGVAYDGDRCAQVLVWYAAQARPQAVKLVPQALAALKWLPAEARARAQAELAGTEALGEQLGADFTLRDGRYRDFAGRFSWKLPAKAFWRARLGPSLLRYDRAARLMLEEPHEGVSLLVSAQPTPAGATAASEHQRLARRRGATSPLQTSSRDLGTIAALESYRPKHVDGMPFVEQLVTATAGGRSYAVALWGLEGNVRAARQTIGRVLAGFALLAPTQQATERHGQTFVDRLFGFRFTAPTGWKLRDTTPGALGSAGRVLQWQRSGEQIELLVVRGQRGNSRFFEDLIEQRLREGQSSWRYGKPTRKVATLGGRACRHLHWGGIGGRVDAYLFSRGELLYAVILRTKLTGSDAATLAQGFTLLD